MPLPSLLVHPPGVVNLDEAHAAIEQWEHYSKKTLDSSQRLAVELMMAEGRDGRWAARTTGRAEPRQNGKGDELEVVEAWGLTQRGEWIVHTAHEIPTAKSAHRRLVGHLESHRDLRRLIRQVRYANGDQSIEMTNGAIVVYRTRTAGGGRGLDDISRIIVDEAQHAQPEQLASSMPILAANPNPQANFCGSAGIAERSDLWWSLRLRAIRAAAGSDAGEFAWLEHSAEEVDLSRDGRVLSTPPNVEDVEAWRKANPALGDRIEEAFLAEELRTLGPALFAREHLCVWDPYPGDEGGFLPYDQWADLAISDPAALRSVCYGLAVSDQGAVVASAGRLPSGDLYIDMVDERPGTDWVIGYLEDLYKRKKIPIRVNPAAPEGAFVRPLTEAKVETKQVTGREYQQACGEVLDTIKNGTIRHLGQTSLDRAVKAVQRRDVGKDGGWVWAEPVSGVDVTSLKAATLALSGVTSKRPPRIHVYKEA
ncbi:MAG TPA: hypothetical protein VJQ79_05985 [Acidimicrobiia bacterium]|nr:hypothetical protein [Acidimicrobiia bacterium]